uniref:CSON004305 protein n=2 Tax=Culicoides sonorensis TaxID=179676 RepID=A0A336K7B2_CULSO
MALAFRVLLQYLDLNDIFSLKNFLDSNSFQVDERDDNGATILMHASSRGVTAFVKELVLRGADIQAEDLDNWTALLCATKAGHFEIVQYLIDHGADIEHREMGGWTPLMWASYKGYIEIVNLLLQKGAEVHCHGNYHLSPLLWGAGRGHYEVVVALINKGAKVNSADKYGTTALIWACRKGSANIVDFLLKAGANVDTAGMYSWTPLLVAVAGGHQECVNLVLERKPNVNALDKDGMTALSIACREGLTEIVSALISVGAYINIQDRSGDTPLIHAIKGNHRSVVEILVKKHADIDIQGKDKKSALYYAIEKGNLQIVRMILSQNPDLELETKDGDTALLRAVRNRNLEMVLLLLEKRAKVGATDKRGDTCLHIAMRARSKAIVEALLHNPKNNQILYKANKVGETPYGIDQLHQRTILGQVFGTRQMNTEDSEGVLGYEVYSSALTNILYEPTLITPITVGLYAKWGSGKSFLLNKVRDEMLNFVSECSMAGTNQTFILFLIVLHISSLFGVLTGMLTWSVLYGFLTFIGIIFVVHGILKLLSIINKRYRLDWIDSLFQGIDKQIGKLKLILQVAFCYPPNISADIHTKPVRFHFADISNAPPKGEQAVGLMLASMLDEIERHYGTVSTRLYRALRPKQHDNITKLRFRRMCCIPIVFLFELFLISVGGGICLLVIYYTHQEFKDYEQSALLIVIYIIGGVLLAALVANFHIMTRLVSALFISQASHLKRLTKSNNDNGLSLTNLGNEVTLMADMVKALDSFVGQQSRLCGVVDVLDYYDIDKILNILSVIQTLFTSPNRPFIILIAVDPHIITKAAEARSKRMLTEVGTIGGHDFLRNLIHLPIYLQSSNVKKIQRAQMAAQSVLNRINEFGERRLSNASEMGMSMERLRTISTNSRGGSKKNRLPPESLAGSYSSNLHKLGQPSVGFDRNRVMFSDDFFSDINPRSMKRLLNVMSLTIRLLKANQIEFSWYRLCSWINLTEQWPLRASIVVLECEKEDFDDTMSLQTIYERCKPKIPYLKEAASFLEMDRDERKLDAFLHIHKNDLQVSDMKVFLPFTFNLDPYLKKVLKEDQQAFEEEFDGLNLFAPSMTEKVPKNNLPTPNRVMYPFMQNPMPMPRGQIGFNLPPQPIPLPTAVPPMPNEIFSGLLTAEAQTSQDPTKSELIPEKHLQNIILSKLTVDQLVKLLKRIPDMIPIMPKLGTALQENAITGRVLMHCDLNELKSVLNISFGHWETFKLLVNTLKTYELSRVSLAMADVQSIPSTTPTAPQNERDVTDSNVTDKKSRNVQSRFQKQVTIEEEMICETLNMINSDILEQSEEDILLDEDEMLPQMGDEIPLTPIRESLEIGSPQRRKSLVRSVTIGDYDDTFPTVISMPSITIAEVNGDKKE